MKNGLIFAKNIIDNLPLLSTYSGGNIICKSKNESEMIKNNANFSEQKFSLYQYIDSETNDFFLDKMYIKSLSINDKIIDKCIEKVLGRGNKVIIDTARTLEEVGIFDAKYKKSPIMFVHSLGILSNSMIAGGVYLDKDDVDLMVQENASLILCPSFDAMQGNGIPPLKLYASRGLNILLGTFDGSSNRHHCMGYEQRVLQLLVNGSLCENAFSVGDIEKYIN